MELAALESLKNDVSTFSRSRLYDGPDLKLFIFVVWDRSFSSVAKSTRAQLMIFFAADFQ